MKIIFGLNIIPLTEQEIDDFIQSTPSFTHELKSFLLNNFFEDKGMLITEEWKKEFVKKVHIWAESFEWSFSGISSIRNSSTIIELLEISSRE
jgi:hypothetical protein